MNLRCNSVWNVWTRVTRSNNEADRSATRCNQPRFFCLRVGLLLRAMQTPSLLPELRVKLDFLSLLDDYGPRLPPRIFRSPFFRFLAAIFAPARNASDSFTEKETPSVFIWPRYSQKFERDRVKIAGTSFVYFSRVIPFSFSSNYSTERDEQFPPLRCGLCKLNLPWRADLDAWNLAESRGCARIFCFLVSKPDGNKGRATPPLKPFSRVLLFETPFGPINYPSEFLPVASARVCAKHSTIPDRLNLTRSYCCFQLNANAFR